MKKLKVTVVIPAYNEVKTIAWVINNSKKYCDEILVVCSKKSKDGTVQKVKSMGIPYIMDNGLGKGDAIRMAVKHIKEGIAVFIDADKSHDPDDIPKLVEPIQKGRAVLVMGSRMKGGSDELNGTVDEFFRLMFSNIITLIINLRFRQHITDYQNGFRAIRIDVAKRLKLQEDITTIEQEMSIKALKKGYKITEVPAHEYDGGKSSFSIWKVGPKYLWQIIRDVFF